MANFFLTIRQFIRDFRAGGVVFILAGGRFYVVESNDPTLTYLLARKVIQAAHDKYNSEHK